MTWAILLLVAALLLVICEVILPTGGALGFLAVCAIIAAVFLAFQSQGVLGATLTLAAGLVLTLLVLGFGLYLYPNTPLGRMMIPQPPENPDELRPDQPRLKSLVGQRGRTRGPMRPSGPVRIDKQTFDAVAEGVAIEADAPVRVVAVRMNRLVVRPEAEESLPPLPGDDPAATGDPPDSLLEQPLEELGLGELEEPLG